LECGLRGIPEDAWIGEVMSIRVTRVVGYGLQLLYGLLGLLVGVLAGYLVYTTPDTLKLFVIVIGVFAFAVSVARLEWGMLLLTFIVYTNLSDIAIKFHGAPSVTKSFVVLLLFAIAMRWIVYSEQPLGWYRAAISMAIYILVTFASVLYAADPSRSLAAVETLIKNALIVIAVVILLQSGVTMRRVVWTLLVAGIFMGTLTIFQYLTNTYNNNYFGFAQNNVAALIGASKTNRVGGPIGDPNYYALIMLVLVPYAMDRIWNERNRWLRLLAIWAFVVCAGAVVLTFSRSGFVALVGVVGLMFLYHTPNLKNLLIIMLISIILLQFIPAQYTARLESLTAFLPGGSRNLRADEAIRGRVSELLVGLRMFQDHPVLGVGYDNYPVYYQEYSRQVGLDPRATERSAHNLYVEILAETGLVGLTVFSLIVFFTLRNLFWGVRELRAKGELDVAGMAAAVGVAVVGYLVASMFIHDAYQRYFWLHLAIAMAVPNVVASVMENHRTYRDFV